jgi:hypothetical protein
MERGVRVNDGSGSRRPDAQPETTGWEERVGIHGQWETRPVGDLGGEYEAAPDELRLPHGPRGAREAPKTATKADLGPCLYFGPGGQRCDRRATKDGFCERHQPGAPKVAAPLLTPKKIAAFFIATAMLWPELVKVVAALLRLLR